LSALLVVSVRLNQCLTLERIPGSTLLSGDRMTRVKVYRSGELARLAGVSTDTLRHYERIGVLARPPRASNGYRVYSAASLNRVLVLQSALRAGFSLAELARILGRREHGGAPCRMVHSLARQKIRSLDEQILRLQELKAFLAKLTRD
jgi:DNA-binding transcriptional MerR regulator